MRVYRWLVRLCPEALRREYGAAMEETMASRLAAARAVGRWRAAKVWWRESAGLVTLAFTERWGRVARMRRARQRLLAAPKAGVMDTIAQELRHAARRMARTPVFTAAAATTLALAIAANAAIFTLVHRVVLNPLPYADSDRLIVLDHGIPSRNVPSGVQVMSWQLYHQLAENARTLDGVAGYYGIGATLTGSGTPERVVITRATPSLASVLRVAPALGRWFTEAEGTPGTPDVAVLTHGFWVRRFGADPSIVGRTIVDRRRAHARRRHHARLVRVPGAAGGSVAAGTIDTRVGVVSVLGPGHRPAARRRNGHNGAHRDHAPDRRSGSRGSESDGHRLHGDADARCDRRQHRRRTLDPARGGRPRAARRVREHRQPVPRPLGIASP